MQFVRSITTSRRALASYACSKPSNLYIVRHGARLDQLEPKWREEAKSLGFDPRDPPLSALGHKQARETAAYFAAMPKEQQPTRILCSPYLRVIQTAVPTADALDLRIEVEEGLAELHHEPGLLPSPTSRFPYFPQLDHSALQRESILVPTTDSVDAATGLPAESYPQGYLARVKKFAPLLAKECEGANIACFSHAASTALVAALLHSSQGLEGHLNENADQRTLAELEEVGPFAPCGVFHLAAPGDREPWHVRSKGGDNTAHVSENHPATYPWPHPEEAHQAWRDMHSFQQ